MISIYKSKESTKSNEICKLLSQTDTWIIGDDLSTKSTIQKKEKIKVKTERKKKFSTNNKKYLGRKQDILLQFETLSHYRNKCIRLHYENNTLTKREINNVQITNYKLDRIKLWDL